MAALRHGAFFLIRCCLLGAPAVPWLVGFELLHVHAGALRWLALPLFPLLYLLTLVGLLALVARLLPAFEPGLYGPRTEPARRDRARRLLRWRDVVEGSPGAVGLTRWLGLFPSLRRALLRALGGKIAEAAIAREVELYPPSLMRLGPGAYIGWGCSLWGVLEVSPDRLLVEPVTVGACSFIGYRCTLGPGARVGELCVLGPCCLLSPGVRLGSRVLSRGYLRAAPRVDIGGGSILGYGVDLHDGVDIGFSCRLGHHVTVGRNARIGDGARLGDHVVVEPGAVIAPRSRIPPHTRVAREAR